MQKSGIGSWLMTRPGGGLSAFGILSHGTEDALLQHVEGAKLLLLKSRNSYMSTQPMCLCHQMCKEALDISAVPLRKAVSTVNNPVYE